MPEMTAGTVAASASERCQEVGSRGWNQVLLMRWWAILETWLSETSGKQEGEGPFSLHQLRTLPGAHDGRAQRGDCGLSRNVSPSFGMTE